VETDTLQEQVGSDGVKSGIEWDLLAVTYVKCKENSAPAFEAGFWTLLNKEKSYRDRRLNKVLGSVKPVSMASTAGFFDFMIVMEATSTAAVSQFCLKELRTSGGTGIAETVVDTQTTVGVTCLSCPDAGAVVEA